MPWRESGVRGSQSDGAAIQSCAIVTTVANSFMAEIHDRMPVMLTKGAESIWLADSDDMTELKEPVGPVPIP